MTGFSFNNELYYHMSKGLLNPDLLEWVSNQTIFGNTIIAPSMQIKAIWEQDEDYHIYKK